MGDVPSKIQIRYKSSRVAGSSRPSLAVRNVPLSLAPKASQDIIAEFGRPDYAGLIANNPIERPLKPEKMVVAFRKRDELVGSKRARSAALSR